MAQARLFTVTQWLLMAAMAVCAFGVVVLGFAAFGLGVVGTGLWVPHGVPALVKGVPLGHVALICAFAVLAGIAILSLAMLIFHAIRQIVASAVGGDPFVVENADRLARTGWLLLGICAIQLTAGAAIAMMIPP
ncbi:MAG: hypothetical protein JO256_00595, partial [Alphaproteobacteria bacterium]|nr:hypothetical protein [Alphaproteobacteria bacterium]